LPYRRWYAQYLDFYGIVGKARAKRTYDAYVHLPVEFPASPTGTGRCPRSSADRPTHCSSPRSTN